MRRLILLDAARLDRRRIRAWFRQPGAGDTAARQLGRLETAIATLTETPFANRAGPVTGTRVLISQGHRIIYRVLPDLSERLLGDVVVLRIYGPGQAGD